MAGVRCILPMEFMAYWTIQGMPPLRKRSFSNLRPCGELVLLSFSYA